MKIACKSGRLTARLCGRHRRVCSTFGGPPTGRNRRDSYAYRSYRRLLQTNLEHHLEKAFEGIGRHWKELKGIKNHWKTIGKHSKAFERDYYLNWHLPTIAYRQHGSIVFSWTFSFLFDEFLGSSPLNGLEIHHLSKMIILRHRCLVEDALLEILYWRCSIEKCLAKDAQFTRCPIEHIPSKMLDVKFIFAENFQVLPARSSHLQTLQDLPNIFREVNSSMANLI